MDNLEFLKIDSTNWKNYETLLQTLCLSSETEESPAAQNMHWINWQNNTASLMYALVNEKRFDPPRGLLTLILKNGTAVACSGCYQSDWSTEVLIIGVRTWTHPDHRDNWWHGKYLLPQQIDFANQAGFSSVLMTINEHNERLQKFIKRMIDGKTVIFGEINPTIYKNFVLLDEDYYIRGCRQKVAIMPLKCTLDHFKKFQLPPKAPL